MKKCEICNDLFPHIINVALTAAVLAVGCRVLHKLHHLHKGLEEMKEGRKEIEEGKKEMRK